MQWKVLHETIQTTSDLDDSRLSRRDEYKNLVILKVAPQACPATTRVSGTRPAKACSGNLGVWELFLPVKSPPSVVTTPKLLRSQLHWML